MFKHVYINTYNRIVTNNTANTIKLIGPISSVKVKVIKANLHVLSERNKELSYTYIKLKINFSLISLIKLYYVNIGYTCLVVKQD
jgi:hypothetical protein